MSLTIANLNLPADKLAQFAKAFGDAGGQNAALQGICDGAAATVARLTAGYVLDDTDLTNFGRCIALYRAYAQAQFGEIPKAIAEEYTTTMDELTAIAEGKRLNLPKVTDPAQNTVAGGWGGGTFLKGKTQ